MLSLEKIHEKLVNLGIAGTPAQITIEKYIPKSLGFPSEKRIPSWKTFPVTHSADAVLLATGYNFPDALAGASLGVLDNAPLLLVNPYTDNQKTITEIRRVLEPGGTNPRPFPRGKHPTFWRL
ncbi:cell wall-binding repeat-containing protein [Desulfosporosinus lacus]|uniref:Putative cell wall binding repeat 2 n=1 Tax=Desulfosporosinus lacus DSM 15449 TaxID=1121420 RepID=A0A1M6D0S0_9FIRM|nr:cell wall-binding repeat-containing protein [Desulfosporosinus lacus]SHI66809.1 Putative cell wall binding repeat 2 [Desulfosporosinus lacus DSM 15449]